MSISIITDAEANDGKAITEFILMHQLPDGRWRDAEYLPPGTSIRMAQLHQEQEQRRTGVKLLLTQRERRVIHAKVEWGCPTIDSSRE